MAKGVKAAGTAEELARAAIGDHVRLFIGGEWTESEERVPVHCPYDGRLLWSASAAQAADLHCALEAAGEGAAAMAALPAHARSAMLRRTHELLARYGEELAGAIMLECGKPIRLARAEVQRCLQTFSFAAEEARRIGGEVIPMDAQPEGEGRLAFTMRQPLGVIGAITPFNFPLNLVAHKLAPALAAGNAVVLKPSPQTPATAALLLDLLLEAGLPRTAVQLVHGGAAIGEALVSDPRPAMITFTGGTEGGQAIRARAGMKRVTLELGSNAAMIIDRDVDVEKAAARCISGAFHYSGQSCISLQRMYVHRDSYDAFVPAFLAQMRQLRVGDPRDESIDIGPLISEAAAQRIQEWIDEAIAAGAEVLGGGSRNGSLMEPTLLAGVAPGCRIASCEAFGPVALVWPFDELEQAIAAVNDSRYGLNAGVFTRDIQRAFMAAHRLEAGTVLINDIPTYRVEHMPYGGVKQSGMGREGVRYAIEEMTQEKLVIVNSG